MPATRLPLRALPALALAALPSCGWDALPPPLPPGPAWHTLIADNLRAIEVDEQRRTVWSYEADPMNVHLVERLPDGTTSLALSSVSRPDVGLVVDRDGRELFRYEAHLDEQGLELQGLHSVVPAPDGTFVLTDTINDRVLAVDDAGAIAWSITPRNFDLDFANPNDARVVVGEDGSERLVVSARGDRFSHVLQFVPDPSPEAPFPWALDSKLPEVSDQQFLSQPHNPHDLGGGLWLVSAAGEDRVKWVDAGADTVVDVFPAHDCDPLAARPLGWPRDARLLDSGNLLVADSNHGRVIEVAAGARCLSDPAALVWTYEALDRPYSAIRLLCRESGGRDVCY